MRKGKTFSITMVPMQVVQSGYRMEGIALYILGELPETENGNKYFVVISDYFTKWTESFAMPNMTARTCAKILVKLTVTKENNLRLICLLKCATYFR